MQSKLLCLPLFLLASSPIQSLTYFPFRISSIRVRRMSVPTKSIKSFFTVQSSSVSGKKRKADDISEEVSLPTTANTASSSKQPKLSSADDAVTDSISPIKSAVTSSSSESNADDAVPPTAGWPPMDTLEPSWRQRLLPEMQRQYFQRLLQFLSAESRTNAIFPPSNQLFTALNLCPFDSVKVVVIGQDPYHGPGQAHGLAFSVQKNIQIPPSLRNMITEAQNDPAVRIPVPTHGNLECWAKQGVLLLNTVLTVRKAEANSHQKKGWEEFTDAIVRELGKKEGLVYLLWGKPAQSKCAGIDHRKNKILTSSHPSPLSAYKTSEPFIGSRMFSRCNEALQELGKEPIDWRIR